MRFPFPLFLVLFGCAGGEVGFKSLVNNESTLIHYVSREQAEIEERKRWKKKRG